MATEVYPVPQKPEGQYPKATDVSLWYGVYRKGIVHNLADPLRDGIEKSVLVIFLLTTTSAFAFLPHGISLGIAAGGGIALFSFISLRKTLVKAFGFILSGTAGAGGYIAARYYLKLLLLLVFLFLVLRDGRVDAVGVAIGLFVVPAALIYSGLRLHLTNSRRQIV